MLMRTLLLFASLLVFLAPSRADVPHDHGLFQYLGGFEYDESIPTPASVIGFEMTERFTRYGDMKRYLDELADASPRVAVTRYGESYQGRSLNLLTISSPENLDRLDQLLADNRRLAERDLSENRRRRIAENHPAIVWLSYTVHGNEGSTVNTALVTAYTLAAATNPEVKEWLDNVIVVIDPLLNPDGYMRYVSWFENTMGRAPDASRNAAERFEPWPGGRSNHYLFDLNRDWLWRVHPESRSRIEIYRRYLPHLHIDYHEQGFRNPFFLGAGDTPYSTNIPQETKDWIEKYGEENAVVFDQRGLQYSSRERFDYLYPGYGKVLPVYHGAIGMLAEQAGHSRGGLAIEVDDHYTLTLAERVDNHFLLSMSNIETTSKYRREQLERFHRFFSSASEPGAYRVNTYLVSAATDPARMELLWDLLDGHGIEVDELTRTVTRDDLHDYRTNEPNTSITLPEGSWVVRAAQPMGALATTLFEPETDVEDIDTYDITSWSVPIAFGLEAYYALDPIHLPTRRLREYAAPAAEVTGEGSVALIISADQHHFPRAVALAMDHELTLRLAGEDFRVDDRDFPMGSLIVHFIRNDSESLDRYVEELLDANLHVHRASRGMTESGPVLGANANRFMTLPSVALLRGSGTSSLSFGQIWHLLDHASPMAHTLLDIDRLGWVDLDEYNVLILPHAGGGFATALGRSNAERIEQWVRDGGTLIALGGTATWANRTLLELDRGAEIDEDAIDEELDEERPPLSELTREERRDRSVEDRIPGATLAVDLDRTHPLSAGAGAWIGLIKRGGRTLDVRDSAEVVGRFAEAPRLNGSISERNQLRLANTPAITIHPLGRGKVISFVEDPTLRGFNHAPARLLLNAIIFGPSL